MDTYDASQPLKPKQISRLAMLRKAAFEVAKRRGAVDDDADFREWYLCEQGEAIGRDSLSLTEAKQADFRLIRGRFFVILGNAEAAFADFMEGGAVNEDRRQKLHRLAAQVGSLADALKRDQEALEIARLRGVPMDDAEAGRQAWAYCVAVARDKARGRRLHEMTPKELAQLGFTMLNRASAKRGVGRPENRNKSQRAAARQSRCNAEETAPAIV